MRSIEGRWRAAPASAYPVQRGIDGAPTAINNVETWANIPEIFAGGAESFAGVGTERNSAPRSSRSSAR